MRIISYNILDGGEGRADPLAEIILAQRPDVVALVEADDPTVLERIAGRLDMDFIHARAKTDAAALLSRWPIRETINHGALQLGLSKACLDATVIAPDGVPWNFGVVHLHAHAKEEDEAQREKEIAIILDLFAAKRSTSTPHILLGDFNANSPHQKMDPARCKPSTREEWAANGGRIPRRVIQRVLEAGYADSLRELHGAPADTVGTFSTQFPGQRVDYIFTHSLARRRLTAAWIEQDRLAKYASDHFPVGAEIV